VAGGGEGAGGGVEDGLAQAGGAPPSGHEQEVFALRVFEEASAFSARTHPSIRSSPMRIN
jgi:hypothetical protein